MGKLSFYTAGSNTRGYTPFVCRSRRYSPDPNACYSCGRTGHWIADCPQKAVERWERAQKKRARAPPKAADSDGGRKRWRPTAKVTDSDDDSSDEPLLKALRRNAGQKVDVKGGQSSSAKVASSPKAKDSPKSRTTVAPAKVVAKTAFRKQRRREALNGLKEAAEQELITKFNKNKRDIMIE